MMNWTDEILNFVGKNRKTLQLIVGILLVLFILISELPASAQSLNSQGFIYGKVYTRDNTYVGQIRWGKEEAFWNDLFNASKTSIKIDRNNRNSKDDSWFSVDDWSLSSIWDNKRGSSGHQFVTQFGNIAQITKSRDSDIVYLLLKDGNELKLDGSGTNDVGTTVRVLDAELGQVNIKWSRIAKIEFLSTPQNLTENFGRPIYGTVETLRKGKFTGYIQWDRDERLGKDKLDGSTRDGEVSIYFDQLRSIYSKQNGSEIELLSGRKMFVYGSNDVNKGNRGIIVTVEGIGKIEIPWRAFRGVEFQDSKMSGESYNSYGKPKKLSGKVFTFDNEEISGSFMYDLDETWDFEMIEGHDDELEYKVPIKNIKSIKPKNYAYSQVTFRNGESVLLGKGRDVTDSNDGLLILERGQREARHVRWRDIAEISFE